MNTSTIVMATTSTMAAATPDGENSTTAPETATPNDTTAVQEMRCDDPKADVAEGDLVVAELAIARGQLAITITGNGFDAKDTEYGITVSGTRISLATTNNAPIVRLFHYDTGRQDTFRDAYTLTSEAVTITVPLHALQLRDGDPFEAFVTIDGRTTDTCLGTLRLTSVN